MRLEAEVAKRTGYVPWASMDIQILFWMANQVKNLNFGGAQRLPEMCRSMRFMT